MNFQEIHHHLLKGKIRRKSWPSTTYLKMFSNHVCLFELGKSPTYWIHTEEKEEDDWEIIEQTLDMFGFELALTLMKQQRPVRRDDWPKLCSLHIVETTENDCYTVDAHFILVFFDGQGKEYHRPWLPTADDLLCNRWQEFKHNK